VLERRTEVGIVLGHLCNFLEPGAQRPGRLAADHLEGRSLQAMLGPALIRRSVFEQIGLFSTEPGIWVDWEWFARAQRAGIVRHVQEEVMLYRRLHDANMSNPLDEKHHRLLSALRLGLAEQRQGSRP
jgi:hypothetical protein